MSPLVMALSATNATWSSFRQLKNYPSDYGWRDYFNNNGIVSQDPQSKALGVFTSVMGAIRHHGAYEGDKSFPSAALNGTGMSCGLVVLHDEDSAIVRIAFRAVKTDMPGQLLGMPLFFTEVRFQGLPDK
jgi:hypothetical protein